MADTKDTQITTVGSVNQIAQASFDDGRAKGNAPEVEQRDQQGQTGETQEMTQVGAFQIKAKRLTGKAKRCVNFTSTNHAD